MPDTRIALRSDKEAKDPEKLLDVDEYAKNTTLFGDINIPRRAKSTLDDDFSGTKVLGGIYAGLAFDDVPDDGFLEWGIHISDNYGLIMSGTEKIDMSKYEGQKRTEMVTDILITLTMRWIETRRYKCLGVALGVPPRKHARFSSLGENNPSFIASRKYWFSDLDATPFVFELPTDCRSLQEAASLAARKCFPGNIPRVYTNDKDNEVQVDSRGECHIVNETQYELMTHPEYWRVFSELAKKVKDRNLNILFISSTSQGGGVALMRHAAIRLFKLLGVDAHWHVANPSPAAFDITKRKFHNQLQGVTPANEKTRLTQEDKDIWEQWNDDNFEKAFGIEDGPVSKANLIIIDDPQLCGMIPAIKKLNPKARLVYRCHIEINEELCKQDDSNCQHCWNYLYSFIKDCDLFISHPVPGFIPPNVDHSNVLLIPAATDPLDGLNKPLSQNTIAYYRTCFNRVACDQGSPTLHNGRGYFIQIARFDPSKGLDDCVKAYKKFCEVVNKSEPPQLVICGHSSIDDPDGSLVFQQIVEMLESDEYKDVGKDICMVRLPASDQLLNALLRGSIAVLQLSTREGFEIKATEALAKTKVIIIYKTGGLPLQVDDGKTGFIVPKGDFNKVGEIMADLVKNPEKRMEMEATIANDHYQLKRQEFYTVANITHFLYFADVLCWKDDETCEKYKDAKERGMESPGVVMGDGSTQDMKARHSRDLWKEDYKLVLDETKMRKPIDLAKTMPEDA